MAEKDVFSRLKRLFSSNIMVRNIGGDQIKVIDINTIQTGGEVKTNSIQDRFNRVYTTNPSSLYGSQFNQNYKFLRPQLYSEYDSMDMDAIIASSLDIMADESTLKSDMGEILQIRSSNDDVQQLLYNLFYDVLNIDFNLWSWIRQMCKYGDFFLKLEIAEKYGVYNVIPYTAYHMERQEAYDSKDPSAVRFKYYPDGVMASSTGMYASPNTNVTDVNGIYFDNYEMAHFRLLSDVNYLPYGRAIIEPARKLFKQYTMLEDAMLIHRISRAPEKRIFYINVGAIPPNEVDAFMQKTISNMKRTPYINKETGDYNLKFNMQNMLEDFYIPIRGNDIATKIETAKGLEYTGIEDVTYLRDKLFAALKVPRAFMGYTADLNGKCIDPLTKIPLLDGRILTVQEIIDEYNNGIKNYVYSLNTETNNIVPGEIEWAGFTRMNTQTIKVWLDNGEFIRCTPDHKFLTRDGEWKEAQDLQENESLMPLYLRKSTEKKINGYVEVYNPSDGKYKFVHRLVAEHYGLKEDIKDVVIHHDNCNKLNNNPENLNCSMNFWEHRQWHIDHTNLCHTNEANAKRKATLIRLMEEDGDYAKMRRRVCKENSVALVEWIKENGASRKGFVKNPIRICKGCGMEFDVTNIEPSKRNNIYCSDKCRSENWVSPFKNISIENLIEAASDSKNFKELMGKLNIGCHAVLRKLLKHYKFETPNFILEYMPAAHSNIYFMNQFPETNQFYIDNFHPEHNQWKEKYSYKNHKVSRIEWCDDLIDTCDITVKEFHNFGTDAGVIIHNSTLAAQDIRFARTIERIQRIIVSELNRIALVHLYAQGYRDEMLTNFELSMTTPSIIYDQERIELMKSKAELTTTLLEQNLLPSDWIYHNIYHLSEDQFDEMRDLVREDTKRKFRLTQIENEGNDPQESGKSYGTPHDLASLYGKGRMYTDAGNVPEGYNTDADLGRPQETTLSRNKQEDNFGKDRLGVQGMKDKDKNDSDSIRTQYKGGGPLALEGSKKALIQNQKVLSKIDKLYGKKMIFEQDNNIPFMDEEQLLD